MSPFERVIAIFKSPSHRRDLDYNKPITIQAKRGVLLLLNQWRNSINLGTWLFSVREDFVLLHQDFIHYCQPVDLFTLPIHNPLSDFDNYFARSSSKSVEFLDFLECAFKNEAGPKDNDLIRSINLVLERYECPYRLSEFVRSERKVGSMIQYEFKAYPYIYIAQEPVVDDYALKPVLKLFAAPEFDKPNKTFSKALIRHKDGDYPGCITCCATAVEESIGVISRKKGWKVKPGGVGKSTQSFLRQSMLSPKLKTIADFIAERRYNLSDAKANGHGDATDADARFLIGLSAAFIVFLSSKAQ